MTNVYHYLYKITCLVTGNFYVGIHSTRNLDDGYLGSGKLIRLSVHKHGVDNHRKEILEFHPNRELLKEREREIVTEEFLSEPKCLNIQPGGGGGLTTPEHAKKFHTAGWVAMQVNKDHSENSRLVWARHRDKMLSHINEIASIGSQAAKSPQAIAKKKSTFAKIGHAQGSKNSQYGTCWVSNQHETVKIKIGQLEEYLDLGYSRGRKQGLVMDFSRIGSTVPGL